MIYKLHPTIDPERIARNLDAAIYLVSAAMKLIKPSGCDETRLTVEEDQIWHVLYAADGRLSDIYDAIRKPEVQP